MKIEKPPADAKLDNETQIESSKSEIVNNFRSSFPKQISKSDGGLIATRNNPL